MAATPRLSLTFTQFFREAQTVVCASLFGATFFRVNVGAACVIERGVSHRSLGGISSQQLNLPTFALGGETARQREFLLFIQARISLSFTQLDQQ